MLHCGGGMLNFGSFIGILGDEGADVSTFGFMKGLHVGYPSTVLNTYKFVQFGISL